MKTNPYVKLIEDATGAKFLPGNHLTLLQNGDEIFPAMLGAIREAKHSIEFLTYVFWRSTIASQFTEALCERAKAGVKVRFLVDAVGSATMDARSVWQLERAGVELAWFRPGSMRHFHRFNNRTHRKILVVDDRIGFTGGVGIGDVWTGSAQDTRHWRETHSRLEGPACAQLYAGFAENWQVATGEILPSPAAIPPAGTLDVHTTISTSGPGPNAIEHLLFAVFAASRTRLWITTAYFVPSPAIVQALVDAAHRGVDVRILTAGSHTDHYIALLAGRASYHTLLEAGVKLYEYEKTMHHAKIMTADSQWGTIGSTNLDARSLVHNDELNISIIDPNIIGTLDLQFLTDLKGAHHIRSTAWYQRGWASRLTEFGSNLLRHQL